MTYAWYTGDSAASISTKVDGATTNTLTVTDTMVGKFIQVIATGVENSTANAATVVAVAKAEEAEFTISAAQTHAKQIDVTYTSGAPSADSKYVVTKGAQTLTVSSSVTKDNVVSLTMSENLTDGEFKVEATTTAGKKAEATFTGAKPVLTEVKFTNNNLAVSANTTAGMVKGYAHIESTDQFGDHMNLTSPSFTVSKGDASFKSDTGILTLDASNTTDKTYKLGEMVVVSVMYDNNTKVVPATLTVVTAAMAKSITFGEITSDDTTAYPTDKITQSNLARGVYWFPVTEAKDDSDISLDVDRLNAMIDAGTVFVTPKDQKGTIIYADQFTEKTVDGNKIMALVVKGGSELSGLNAAVEMQLSVFSVGGAQATLPVSIARDAVIQTLDIDVPELYLGKTSEIKLSATDTDGNKVDLYKVTSNKSLSTPDADKDTVNSTAAVQSAALRFWDTAQGTNAIGTKITMSTGMNCKWELVRNATDHSVSLLVEPSAAATSDGYLNITGTTAAFTAITKANIKINKTRTIDGVSGFGTLPTKYLTSNTDKPGTISGANTKLTLNDGSVIAANTTDYNANYVQDGGKVLANASSTVDEIQLTNKAGTNEGAKITAVTSDVYLYTMELTGITIDNTDKVSYKGNGFTLTSSPAGSTANLTNNGTGGSASLTVKSTAKTGESDTVKITLYKLSKVSSPVDGKDIRIEQLGTKSVTFSVEDESTASYKIAFDKNDTIMFAGKQGITTGIGTINSVVNGDVLPISITTEAGASVNQNKLQSVKIVNKNNDGALFEYDATRKGIVCTHESNKAAGQKMTATINASVESDGDTVDLTSEFTYVTDQPIVTYTGLYSNSTFTTKVNDNSVAFSLASIGAGDCTRWIKYQDQYYTDASLDGIDVDVTITNEKTAATSVAGTYNNGVVTILGNGVMAAGETFQAVVNGGVGLTLYCTVSAGGVDLDAVKAPLATAVTIDKIDDLKLTGTTIGLTSPASLTVGGTLYISTKSAYDSTATQIGTFTNSGAVTLTTGTTPLASKSLKGGTDYYIIAMPGEVDQANFKAVASSPKTATAGAFASATFAKDGTTLNWKSTDVVDQYGWPFTLTAVTAGNKITVGTDTRKVGVYMGTVGEGTATITFVDDDTNKDSSTFTAQDIAATALGTELKVAFHLAGVAAGTDLAHGDITSVAVEK